MFKTPQLLLLKFSFILQANFKKCLFPANTRVLESHKFFHALTFARSQGSCLKSDC